MKIINNKILNLLKTLGFVLIIMTNVLTASEKNTKRCLPAFNGLDGDIPSIFPYATPSIFRNIKRIDEVIDFQRQNPSKVEEYLSNHPNGTQQLEVIEDGMREILKIAALHRKNFFHMLAERGETQAIKYLLQDSSGNLSKGTIFNPLLEDLYGLRPSAYAFNNGHIDTYVFLIQLEISIDGPHNSNINYSGVDYNQGDLNSLSGELRDILEFVFNYYKNVDIAGESSWENKDINYKVFDMFSEDIQYARDYVHILNGKEEFIKFYIKERDIVGTHSDIRVRYIKQVNKNFLYVATQGKFSGFTGRIKKSEPIPVEAIFYDHFVYDLENDIIVRRMSDIDQKI